MLAATQKAVILRRSGIAVPPSPAEAAANDSCAAEGVPASAQPRREVDNDSTMSEALREWTSKVNALFVSYVAARAAKSLRDSEEARQLNELRLMSSSAHGWGRAAQPGRA